MTITSGGNVGIGTTAMWNNEILSVQRSSTGTVSTVPALLRLTNQGSGRIAKLLMTDSAIIDGIICMVPVNSTDSYFSFGFAGYTESGLVVRSNGNVGIGTTSPSYSLDVNGTVRATVSSGYNFLADKSTGAAIGISGATGTTNYIVLQGTNVTNPDLQIYTGGSERMRITSGGIVCLNTTSIRTTGWTTGVAGSLCSEMLNYGGGQWFVNVNNDEGAYLVLGKTRGTTINANNIVQNNDTLGAIIFQGADGSAVQSGARIIGKVDGTPGASDMPGRLEFHTTADGSTNPTERMRITSGGTVQPGANGTQDLGTSSLRWATVFTSDLSLSNGIGDYTIVEGENDLFLYNNKQCKVYRFMLEQVCAECATPKKS